MTPANRIPSLDVAKGIAILFVIGIHAELSSPSLFYTHAINRAVPMFLVLFGMTSMLWWESRGADASVGAWYRSRLARLLPSYWLAVLAWWIGQRVLSDRHVGVDALLWSLAGYAPWIQTSWFVTVIFQIVVVFPLIHAAYRWLGKGTCLVAGLGAMAAAQSYALPLNAWLRGLLPYYDRGLGFYAFWLFVPPYLWFVVCGMALARFATGVPLSIAIFALVAATAAGFTTVVVAEAAAVSRIAMAAADPARAVLLLAAAAAVARFARAADSLRWLGRNSWEIYVGQMAVHSLGYPAWCRMGGPIEHRIAYASALTLGGVAFALVYSELRRRLSANEARA